MAQSKWAITGTAMFRLGLRIITYQNTMNYE